MFKLVCQLQSEIPHFWPVKVESVAFIRECINSVFTATIGNDDVIIRIGLNANKAREQIQAELEWLEYLNLNGLSVNCPILSSNDNLVESFTLAGQDFHMVCFNRFAGKEIHWSDKMLWNDELFKTWGDTLGKLHFLSKAYQPQYQRRIDWYDDVNLQLDDISHLFSDPKITDIQKQRIDKLKTFAVTADNYGLIHNDFHRGNWECHSKCVNGLYYASVQLAHPRF